ncbi:MAG: glycine cleavage system protein GcvH [Alphaproteobacteria bacterium]|nr:glycine cleavage system protein GcvH [Alphaproteobacteria bacterium]
MIKFTEAHEWIEVENGVGKIGITDFAQGQLGDIVFVELPEVDDEKSKGDEIAVVESVKAASEIYSPVSGEVIEINESLDDNPAMLNSSPEADGWIFKIKLSDESELENLMDKDAYAKYAKENG